MDTLAALLRSVRLVGGVFLDAHFTAPWCVTANMDAGDCSEQLTNPAQLIAYNVVVEGRLLVWIGGQPAVEVQAGEVVLFPHNDGHLLASEQGIAPVRAGHLITRGANGGLARISHGGGGPKTHIVCGFLGTVDAHNLLLTTLPRALKLDIRDGTSRDWIETSVRFAAGELALGRLASSNVLSRLSEVLLVEAVRQYASTLAESELGWLQGMKDPHIGHALSLIHNRLEEPWSAERLAREVALSRSVFVERFTSLVGLPPIRYLTVWRLQTARQALLGSRRSIAQLAGSVGYMSDEAFSRAFKREFGLSPSEWRRHNASG